MRVCFGTLCFSSRLNTASDEEAVHQVVISNGGDDDPQLYSAGPDVRGGRVNGLNMAEGYGPGATPMGGTEELLR